MSRHEDNCHTESAQNKSWSETRVPGDCLLLGMPSLKAYALMLDVPQDLIKCVVRNSMSFSFDLAIEANCRLTKFGHEVELRAQIDKHLRSKDIQALKDITARLTRKTETEATSDE